MEIYLACLTPSKVSLAITEPVAHDTTARLPMAVSLGCIVDGALPPKADIKHQLGAVASVRKRYGIRMPKPDQFKMRRFRRFVDRWLKKNMKPFSENHIFNVDKWLEGTNYSLARKEELKKIWTDSIMLITNKTVRAKAFLKDENYPEYKYPRSINSRSDAFKTFYGPIVKDIEHVLYCNKAFIKHVPVMDRPAYIRARLYRPGGLYMQTDFTAYESSFTQSVMDVTDMRLLNHMCKHLKDAIELMAYTLKAKASLNEIEYKRFLVRILAVRLSGEMDTSCCNGFANLMVNKFIVSELGGKIKMIVEGDDGLAIVTNCSPTASMYADLGFNIKLVMYENLYEASFCGIVFDPDCDVNIADPLKNIAKFGWTTHEYARANRVTKLKLLKAKSESLIWQYPGCPVLQELGLYGLRVTKHINLGKWTPIESWWEREMRILNVKDGPLPIRPVVMSTRLLMEKVFNLRVEEQLKIEDMLRTKMDFAPFNIQLDLFPPVWVDYFTRYASEQQTDLLHPTMHWPERYGVNMGWDDIVVRTGRTSKSIKLGYVDHDGLRYYDCIWNRRPQFDY